MFTESFFYMEGAMNWLDVNSTAYRSQAWNTLCLLLLDRKFCYLWNVCINWNNSRYYYIILGGHRVQVMPLGINSCKSRGYVLDLPCRTITCQYFCVPVLAGVSSCSMNFQIHLILLLCSSHFHNCLFYYFEYTLISVKHFKHSIFR